VGPLLQYAIDGLFYRLWLYIPEQPANDCLLFGFHSVKLTQPPHFDEHSLHGTHCIGISEIALEFAKLANTFLVLSPKVVSALTHYPVMDVTCINELRPLVALIPRQLEPANVVPTSKGRGRYIPQLPSVTHGVPAGAAA